LFELGELGFQHRKYHGLQISGKDHPRLFFNASTPDVRVVLPNLPLSETANSQEPNPVPFDLHVLRSDRPESVAAINEFMDLDLAYRSFIRRLIKSEPSAHDSSSPFSLR
jgi:hypothetical protein